MKFSLPFSAADSGLTRLGFKIISRLTSWTVPPRSNQSELLDRPDTSRSDLAANFRDIKLINRWFGGVSLVEKSLRPMLPPPPGQELKWLDLASGVADIPLVLARRWRKSYSVAITALDLNPNIVALAEAEAKQAGIAQFQAIAADVFAYDFKVENEPPYDFVSCSLAFHHFERRQCVEMLGLMARLARRGFIVNDLERSWFGFLGAHLLGLTLTRQRLTRHDAPLSVLRAFTRAEFRALVQEARLPSDFTIEIKKGPFSRLAIIGTRKQAEAQKEAPAAGA